MFAFLLPVDLRCEPAGRGSGDRRYALESGLPAGQARNNKMRSEGEKLQHHQVSKNQKTAQIAAYQHHLWHAHTDVHGAGKGKRHCVLPSTT